MTQDYPPAIVVLPRQARLDRLIAVLPIARMRRHAGIEVLALALEIYSAGFIVTFQVQSHGAVPFVDDPPTLTLTIADDQGRGYTNQPAGAMGEGAGNEWQWRLGYRCIPALHPHACELRVEITGMTWTRPEAAPRYFVPIRTLGGPWAFTVALPPDAATGGAR